MSRVTAGSPTRKLGTSPLAMGDSLRSELPRGQATVCRLVHSVLVVTHPPLTILGRACRPSVAECPATPLKLPSVPGRLQDDPETAESLGTAATRGIA